MGLLDDAIREHLELKRLKGADAQEVARQERDALGQETGVVEAEDGDMLAAADVEPASAGQSDTAAARLEGTARHRPGQETVELDMESVLDDAGPGPSERPIDEGEQPTDASGGEHGEASQEDSLEWEMPSDPVTADDGDDGGHASADREPGDEDVEDVLEETPDFLRETPEQDRLWFEQRPPRDFDFNE